MITIIAECGINHGGNIDIAIMMVQAAKSAGANAAKFQLFTERARPKGKKYIFTRQELDLLMAAGKKTGIPVFFSVFDFESVRLAKEIGAKWVKLSFVERRNTDLIDTINLMRLPGFERKFVSVDLWGQYDALALGNWEQLYCPNNGWRGYYPTKNEDIEWGRYFRQAEAAGLGWSCHCQGWTEAVVVAKMGAKVIEKHFKITDDCVDADVSTNPEDFARMVSMIRGIEGGENNDSVL